MVTGEDREVYYEFKEVQVSDKPKTKILSGFPSLDRLTKGFELGCVTIWTGITNSGKTTLLTQIISNTIKQGEKVLCFNGEQTPERFKSTIYLQCAEPKDTYELYYKDTPIKDTFVKEEKRKELDKLFGGMMFIYNNEAPRDISSLLVAMEDAYKRYGVRVFFVDNFMQIDMQSSDIFQEQSNVMEKLREFSVSKNVHIHLVAHPRKLMDFQARLSLYDISGSMNLANKAYNVISIIRADMLDENGREYQNLKERLFKDHYDIDETSAIVEVLKTKGSACGLVPLVFDRKTKSYKEQGVILSEEYAKREAEKKKNKYKT